jgi:large subunit ribosomal protein L21e
VIPVSRSLQSYDLGVKARINIESSLQKGMPHTKFQGKIGIVVGRQGRSYALRIKDGGKTRIVTVRPEHLKLA